MPAAAQATRVYDYLRELAKTHQERSGGDCMLICVSRSCTERLVLDLLAVVVGVGGQPTSGRTRIL
jgi:hypothetical protein